MTIQPHSRGSANSCYMRLMKTYSKQEIARRQLGTALHLFLEDSDPISIHCLACGGAELADWLARESGETTFSQHALNSDPAMAPTELLSLRNRYWNAMKHATTRGGKSRDDENVLSTFEDDDNDHTLFIGWYDYASAVGILPIEAQVFQAWYFAKFPEKLASAISPEPYDELFPEIRKMDRPRRKMQLRAKIEWARHQADVMQDPRTDLRPLILPG